MLIIESMRRAANLLWAGILAGALTISGCLTPPNQPATMPSQVGANYPADSTPPTYTPPSTTHPAPLKNGEVNQAQSEALTNYLKAHHLPLVGAQVLAAPDGERQVILFGFVATDYGKGDAESKTRRYIHDSAVTVDNRIKIEPSLANSKAAASQTADPNDLSGVQAYENQRYEDQLQQQQIYGYQNQGPSPMSMMIPFIGAFGGSFGSGGFGFGGGGFGPSFGGGYYPAPVPAYPSYPYP